MTESGSTNDVQSRVNAYWDWRADSYDDQAGHGALLGTEEYRAWGEALKELLPSAPADVLDVGTGTGFMAFLAAELGHRVTGIDLSEGMLRKAREEAPNRELAVPPLFQVGDAVSPDFAPASFDAIVSRHVVWTLYDPQAAFARWLELLRPGGRMVAIDAFWFAGGGESTTASDETVRDQWSRYYGADTRKQLPAMELSDHTPLVEALRGAGFEQVEVKHLTAVREAERTPIGDEPRYALVAQRPS